MLPHFAKDAAHRMRAGKADPTGPVRGAHGVTAEAAHPESGLLSANVLLIASVLRAVSAGPMVTVRLPW